jgi:uncharacterized protein (DUF885 family)
LRYIIALLLLTVPPIGWKGEERIPLPREVADAVVDSIGREYYRAKFELYPAYATAKGVHDYDSMLSTFSRQRLRRFMTRIKALQGALGSFDEDSLSMSAWIDLKALSAEMGTQALLLEEIRGFRKWPIMYSDACIDGIRYLLIRPGPENVNEHLASRLAKIPEVTSQARVNLTEPVRLNCEVTARNIRDFLPFLAGLSGQEAGTGADVDQALVQQAYQSLDGFAAYLDTLALTAEPDFALGRHYLEEILKTQHMIENSPEDLLAYAEEVLVDAHARRAASLSPSSDVVVDTAEAGTLTRQDLISHYQAEVESARAFIRLKDLVTLPEHESIEVMETPGYLRNLITSYAYESAAPFEEDQAGQFYVSLPAEIDLEAKLRYAARMEARGYAGVVVHEAFPGHHMQLVLANRNPSYIGRLQDNMLGILR